jgi:Zn-dependent peptidase ImmA (M78 family)
MGEIDEIVLGIMETYGTNNPYEILDAMDISIIEVDDDNPILLGKNSVFIDTLNTVFIKNELHQKHKMFYLRHELGHIILHLDAHNISLPKEDKHEKEADYFALKLSQLEFDEIMMYQMTYEQIASCLEVPIRALKQLVKI